MPGYNIQRQRTSHAKKDSILGKTNESCIYTGLVPRQTRRICNRHPDINIFRKEELCGILPQKTQCKQTGSHGPCKHRDNTRRGDGGNQWQWSTIRTKIKTKSGR